MWLTGVVKKNPEGTWDLGSNQSREQGLSSLFKNSSKKSPEGPLFCCNSTSCYKLTQRNHPNFWALPVVHLDLDLQKGGMTGSWIIVLVLQWLLLVISCLDKMTLVFPVSSHSNALLNVGLQSGGVFEIHLGISMTNLTTRLMTGTKRFSFMSMEFQSTLQSSNMILLSHL